MGELPVLEQTGVLTPETAERLRAYYATTARGGLHWAIIAFAVLGALLIGSGIILLFAHNWDAFTRPTRAILSLCPIALGATLCAAALLRDGGAAWREGAATFHTLSIGASIALIGQTYHLPSDVPGFLLAWTLLALPLPFILRATSPCLIYLALVCGWTVAANDHDRQAVAFWPLLLPAVIYVGRLLASDRHSAQARIALAGLLAALCIGTGVALTHAVPGLWIIAYAALLSGAYLFGVQLYGERDGWSNVPKLFGVLGVTVLAYIFTWSDMWSALGWCHLNRDEACPWGVWADGAVALALLAGWAVCAAHVCRRRAPEALTMAVFPILATVGFALASNSTAFESLNALLFDAFLVYLGVFYIVLGCRNSRLRQLNGGMAILSLLLVTRFFDTHFDYLARGLAFIVIGIVFLAVNIIVSRRKRKQEGAA
jgi:uncharacterized membrane protein